MPSSEALEDVAVDSDYDLMSEIFGSKPEGDVFEDGVPDLSNYEADPAVSAAID